MGTRYWYGIIELDDAPLLDTLVRFPHRRLRDSWVRSHTYKDVHRRACDMHEARELWPAAFDGTSTVDRWIRNPRKTCDVWSGNKVHD